MTLFPLLPTIIAKRCNMNKARLNQISLNVVSLNRAGLPSRSKNTTGGGKKWKDVVLSSTSELFAFNAMANSISSLILSGGCKQDATPSTTVPVPIKCNKGAISHHVLGDNLLEVKDENIVVGKYINNAGVVTTSLPNLYFQRFVSVKASTAYTLSTSEALNYANFMEYDADGVFIKRTLYGSSGTPAGKAITHTMGASTAFVIVGSNINATKYPEVTKDEVKGIKWMFCEGSTVKPYEAYRAGFITDGEDVVSLGQNSVSAEMLLGISRYAAEPQIRDTQDVITGVITRKTHIKAFDGSEPWYFAGDEFELNYDSFEKKPTTCQLFCTHYKYDSVHGITHRGMNISINSEGSLEDFRKFLAMEYAKGTPVTIVYLLKDEETEKVAAQPLPNAEGNVLIQRKAEMEMPMEATLKVQA